MAITPIPSAFTLRNLSILAYAQGFTLWHYKIHAALTLAAAPGFFNPAADMLSAGDMILVSGSNGGTLIVVAASSEERGVHTASMVTDAFAPPAEASNPDQMNLLLTAFR